MFFLKAKYSVFGVKIEIVQFAQARRNGTLIEGILLIH
jgi:hypothetical protein